MKKLTIIAALASALTCGAQTNTVPPTSLLPGGLSQLVGDVGNFFTDAKPYFTNGVVRPGLAGIYLNKKYGGLLDVQIPVNSQITMGFAGAYYNNTFYDASFSTTLGTTWNVPLIGHVYSSIGSGPGWDFKKHQAIAHSEALLTKDIRIGKGDLYLSVGALNVSSVSGVGYVAGASYAFHF